MEFATRHTKGQLNIPNVEIPQAPPHNSLKGYVIPNTRAARARACPERLNGVKESNGEPAFL